MDKLEEFYNEFTIPLPTYIDAGTPVRGISLETFKKIVSLERELGHLQGFQEGIDHVQQQLNEMLL
jgi:hypothetical protein